jgi:magnesium transporter
MGHARTRVYRQGVLVCEDFPVADISDYIATPDSLVWVDFCDPTEAQLDEVAAELGLHELAVEDALGPHQRPKLDHYDSHIFLTCHAVKMGEDAELTVTEIDAFVSTGWMITVRKGEGFPLDAVLRRWDRSCELTTQGASFLLYGLLDVVVDQYFEAVQAFDDYYDDISDGIFADQPLDPAQQRHWFQTRRSLQRYHRLVVPMRESVSALMRHENGIVPGPLYPYFQDVYDHVLRVSESTESLRDLVSTIVETNLSLRDYRQNQVMKKVTSWAAINAVPTLITGYYGMNVPYPGYGQDSGVVVSAGLILALSGLLYAIFRRREWL